MSQYTPEFVYKTFQDIDAGLYTNAAFSHANVVMLSREYFSILEDAYYKMSELESKNDVGKL